MQSNDALVDLAAGWIDQAALNDTHFQAIRTFNEIVPISEHQGNLDSELNEVTIRKATAWAFAYQLQIVQSDGKWRVQLIPYFADSGGHSTPPKVEDVPESGVEVWRRLNGKVNSNFGKARLNHLLFARKVGNPRDHAIAAARSHLDLSYHWRNGLDKSESLHTALRLARAVGAVELASEVSERILEVNRQTISAGHDKPGVTLRLLRPLSYERNAPEGLAAALDSAIDVYDSPFTRDELLTLKLNLHRSDGRRKEIRAHQVQVWLDAAESTTGLIKSGHLKKALERAQESNDSDLIERAASALQKIRDEDLGLLRFSATSAVPQEQFEKILSPITDCSDWRQALMNFALTYGPAVGTVDNTRTRVQEFVENATFASILTTELIGSDGLPRFTPKNDSDTEEMRMAQQESFMLQHTAPILAAALHKIPETHGTPTERELTEFLALGKLTDEDLAASISRCLIRYWTGDPEAAAFSIAPKIETLARNLVIALDAGVYRLQRNEKPGQYPGLGSLLGILREKGLDESWYRNILTICGNPAGGWNLRNEIAHGFLATVGSPAAAILFQCVLYLWTLGPQSSDGAVNEPSES